MGERYEEETQVTEVRREPPEGPPPGEPPWWRENWWIWLLVLLLLVGLLIAFFALRGGDDDDAADARATVPSVLGLSETEARETLEREGLEVEVTGTEESDKPEGTVIEQDPEAGAQLARGAVVSLVLSAGAPETVTQTVTTDTGETDTETQAETETETEAETETVETQPQAVQVPDVVGASHLDAGAAIDETGLIANTYPVASQEERGTVVAQNPDPGTELRQGQPVRLNVSLGPGEREVARIPDVTGREEREARQRLREAGFTVRTVDRQAPEPRHRGVVILQQPAPGDAPVLTQVTIFVGR